MRQWSAVAEPSSAIRSAASCSCIRTRMACRCWLPLQGGLNRAGKPNCSSAPGGGFAHLAHPRRGLPGQMLDHFGVRPAAPGRNTERVVGVRHDAYGCESAKPAGHGLDQA